MKITIIVVNFNSVADTAECLKSLSKLIKHDFELEIVLVDNASTDGSVVNIRKEFPHVTILVNSQNLGFSEGNNVGISYSLKRSADFILLLNNDTTVDQHLVTKLLDAAKSYPQGGIFCPKIYFYPGFETHRGRYKASELGQVIWYGGGLMDWDNVLGSHRGVDEVDKGQYQEVIKTAYGTGCALFVRRAVFEKVGMLDPKFYLYYEDLDFSMRSRKKGFEIFYVPQALIWHKNAGSAGGTGSDLQAYYITRNRLLVGMRYAPWRTKLALFREATNMLMSGTKTQRQAIGDFLRKKYGRREEVKLVTIKLPTFKWPTFYPKWPPMRLPKLPKNKSPKSSILHISNIKPPRFPSMPNLLKYFKKKENTSR